MIALQVPPPEPPLRQVERVRDATQRRFRRAQRRGYATILRVGGCAAAVLLPIMFYVMLTANVTSLNYKLARVQAQKTALQAQTLRQEDRIAKLLSRERLAAVAAQLHMHDPQVYALVTLPATPKVPARRPAIALIGAMNQWLDAAAGDITH